MPCWDVHRHRAARQARDVLEEGLNNGRLRQVAGRTQRVQTSGNRLRLTWSERAAAYFEYFDAERIINCSGPSSAIQAWLMARASFTT